MKNSLRILSLALVASMGMTACGDDEERDSSPMSATDLCLMHYIGYMNEVDCSVDKMESVDDLDQTTKDFICRPGAGDRNWADKILGAIDAGTITMDWADERD